MTSSPFLKLAAAACAAFVVLHAASASAQPLADSTGGSSQARGELAVTPAGIVPARRPARISFADESMHGSYQPWLDSTGGNSEARAERAVSGDRATGVASARRAPVNDAH